MTFEIAEVDKPMSKSGRIYTKDLWKNITEKGEKYNIYIGLDEDRGFTDICGIVDKIWINEHNIVMANATMLESNELWNNIFERVKESLIDPKRIKLFPSGYGFLNMVDDKPIVSDYKLESFTIDIEPKKE